MPDITVTTVLGNCVDNRLHRVYLIRSHHQKLLLACNEDHITADGLVESAFGKKAVSETVEMDYLFVVCIGKFIDRQKPLLSIEDEMAVVVICKIERAIAITDNEELKEA